jgi:1-acyl-sn-glycerol-3-phosphate acyltransferase
LPVVPIVIRGSRHKLPAYRFLPSPGPISVWVCPPLESRNHDSSRELMHATRRVMLEHLDEPDLAAHGHGRRRPAEMPADAPSAGDP